MIVPFHAVSRSLLVPHHAVDLKPPERTVPEKPATMAIQVHQLEQGLRRVVYFPKGTPLMKRPKMAKALETPEGMFFYDPKTITSGDILRAQEADRLNEILGAADGGMGPQSKDDVERSGDPAVAVVGKSAHGTVAQGTLATRAGIPLTVQQVSKVTPKGGKVSVESPAKTIADRKEKK